LNQNCPDIHFFYSSWRNTDENLEQLFLPTFMYKLMLSDAKKTHLTLWVSWAKNSKRSIGQLDSVVSFRSGKNIIESFFCRRPSNEHSHQAWFKFAIQFWERKSKWKKLADDDEECKVMKIPHFLWVRSAKKQLFKWYYEDILSYQQAIKE
jgi:hypothetical protein